MILEGAPEEKEKDEPLQGADAPFSAAKRLLKRRMRDTYQLFLIARLAALSRDEVFGLSLIASLINGARSCRSMPISRFSRVQESF